MDRRALAWMTAALTRAKEMPRFEDFGRLEVPNREQSRDELQASFDALMAAWGAKVE